MGIWDNLKSRLGMGGGDSRYDDEYDDYDAYHDAYGSSYIDDDEPAGSRFESRNTSSTAPLVNMTDIRSQPVALSRGYGSREDRIPPPVVRPRRSTSMVGGLADSDSEAFRDSLARSSQNSLIQLHEERIQMEASAIPELDLTATSPSAASSSTAGPSTAAIPANTTVNPASGVTVAARPRSFSGPRNPSAAAISARANRDLEHLKPTSYADAENISISLRRGSVVVLDLTDVRPELAKRILDFSFGVTSAFEGQVDRFADRVYILTRNGALTEAERSRIFV